MICFKSSEIFYCHRDRFAFCLFPGDAMRHTGKALVSLFFLSTVCGCGPSESAEPTCLPSGIKDESPAVAAPKPNDEKLRTTLYLDFSLSMVNYLDVGEFDPLNAPPGLAQAFQYGPLVGQLPTVLSPISRELLFSGFGTSAVQRRISEKEFDRALSSRCFSELGHASNERRDRGTQRCQGKYKGNKNTDFIGLFQEVEGRVGRGELAVIVSDLIPSGERGIDELVRPLTRMIARGSAVAIVSASVGYAGTMDIPGKRFKYVGRAPFHVLVVGPSSSVRDVLAGIRSNIKMKDFRLNSPDMWHEALFDRTAASGLSLGKAKVGPLPSAGVFVNRGDPLPDDAVIGKYLMYVEGASGANRQITVSWPVVQANVTAPVEHRLTPISQVWRRMQSDRISCDRAWIPEEGQGIQGAPSSPSASLQAKGTPPSVTLFNRFTPGVVRSKNAYLWRLGWQQDGAEFPAAEEAFLKRWSIDSSGLATVTAPGEPLPPLFPTYEFATLYRSLWQAAYGTGSAAAKTVTYSSLVSVAVE